MKNTIEPGDHVRVNFNQAQMTLSSRAVVVAKPEQACEYWIFQDVKTSEVHYVSEPCTITLLEQVK